MPTTLARTTTTPAPIAIFFQSFIVSVTIRGRWSFLSFGQTYLTVASAIPSGLTDTSPDTLLPGVKFRKATIRETPGIKN
jgi:hypothetical protein